MNVNDFPSMRAESEHPVAAIDAALLWQPSDWDVALLHHLAAQGAATPRIAASEPDAAPAPAHKGSCSQTSPTSCTPQGDMGPDVCDHVPARPPCSQSSSEDVKLSSAGATLLRDEAKGMSRLDQPAQGMTSPACLDGATGGLVALTLPYWIARRTREERQSRSVRDPPEDLLLASVRVSREMLRQRQQELQARAASEHVSREQPTSGWYTLKGAGFHRQLRRCNELNARARRGQSSTLQMLATL